jgi:murein DD-endopeptidase MepM/ murein hydrolase activator NlpD
MSHVYDRILVGTPLLAVFDATVAEVRQSEAVSGIHVRNLFKWNSVMLANDDGTFVEYVHIKAGSVALQVGDRVVQGQQV